MTTLIYLLWLPLLALARRLACCSFLNELFSNWLKGKICCKKIILKKLGQPQSNQVSKQLKKIWTIIIKIDSPLVSFQWFLSSWAEQWREKITKDFFAHFFVIKFFFFVFLMKFLSKIIMLQETTWKHIKLLKNTVENDGNTLQSLESLNEMTANDNFYCWRAEK